MHPEGEALLAEARLRPEDDPARLILADWLEDRGDESSRQWATLIRDEVRLLTLHPDDPERLMLLERTRASRDSVLAWAGPPVVALGMVEVRPAGGLCRLVLRPMEGEAGPNWQGLERLPRWRVLDGLHLLRPLDEGRWREIYFAALRDLLADSVMAMGYLALHDAIDDNLALVLTESPGLGAITSLDLTASGLTFDFLRLLVTSPRLRGVSWLALGDCHLTAEAAGLLAASPFLGALRHLELCNNDLGPAGAERLGQGRARPRYLGLALNHLRSAGVEALLATPLSPGLSHLDLSSNGIGDRGAVLLATAPQLAGLDRLYLDRNGIGAAGARALAESPYLGRLSYLYINLATLELAERALLQKRYGDRVR